MNTSRLATLLFTILSVSTASHASQTQSEDGYYLATVKKRNPMSDSLFSNGKTFCMYIQGSTPLSIIHTYLKNNSLPPEVSSHYLEKEEGLSFYQFKTKYCTLSDTASTSENKDTSSFPYYPTLKDTLKESQETYKFSYKENMYTIVIFTKDASQSDDFKAVEIKTKNEADYLFQELFPNNTNGTQTSNTNNIVNNNNNNTSQNNHLNNNNDTPLPPSSDTNQNNNNTQNIVNNNNQSTLNNNNNNASNQAGIYILVVFGLAVCAGIVYAILQKSPTPNSHKPNQDTPQQTP